jgi:hypothetical protein
MAAESQQVLLNGGRDVGVSLVSGADEFLGALLAGAPAKIGVVVLRVVKNAAGQPFVAVIIGSKHVGFLSQSDAEDLLPTLAECERRGAVAQAKGSVSVSQDGLGKPVMRISLAEPGLLLGSVETEVPPSPLELPAQQPMPDQPCRTCGKGLPADARFCLECGTPVPAVSVPAERTAVPAPALPVAPRVAPFAPTTQPAHLAGVPDRSSSSSVKLSISSQIVVAIASLLLLIAPFLPWATAGVFSASGLQETDNEALLLVGLGAIGLAVSAFSLVTKKDSLRFVSLYVGVLGLVFSVYYLDALKDQIGQSSNEILEFGIGAGIYLCLVASIIIVLAALAVLFGAKRRQLAPGEQFSGMPPTKGRGRSGRRGGLQKAGVIVGGVIVGVIVAALIISMVAGGEDKEAVASPSTTTAISTAGTFAKTDTSVGSAPATTSSAVPDTTTSLAESATTTIAPPTSSDSGAAAPLDAAGVVDRLKAAGLPIASVTVFDAASDPNGLLGRPGQYTSKANWTDSKLGVDLQADNNGTVEVFATEADAKARKEYVDAISKDMPLVGYYTYRSGVYVLRITFDVTPDQAKQYEAAFLDALK